MGGNKAADIEAEEATAGESSQMTVWRKKVGKISLKVQLIDMIGYEYTFIRHLSNHHGTLCH